MEQPNNVPEPEIVTSGDSNCYCYVSLNVDTRNRDGVITDISLISANGSFFNAIIIDDDTNPEDVKANLKSPDPFETRVGTSDEIGDELAQWLDDNFRSEHKCVQFVMDKVVWDWPIFLEFLTPSGVIPLWVSPVIDDLNSDLANAITLTKSAADKAVNGEGEYNNFVPHMIACKEVDRFEAANNIGQLPKFVLEADPDNTFRKAFCIKKIHQALFGVKE